MNRIEPHQQAANDLAIARLSVFQYGQINLEERRLAEPAQLRFDGLGRYGSQLARCRPGPSSTRRWRAAHHRTVATNDVQRPRHHRARQLAIAEFQYLAPDI